MEVFFTTDKLWDGLSNYGMDFRFSGNNKNIVCALHLIQGIGADYEKIAKLKTLSVCPNIFSASNFFMHIFDRTLKCMQTIDGIPRIHYEELISQRMHYQLFCTRCRFWKMAMFKTLSFCQKILLHHKISSRPSSICL